MSVTPALLGFVLDGFYQVKGQLLAGLSVLLSLVPHANVL
jgi:hypothetical protein